MLDKATKNYIKRLEMIIATNPVRAHALSPQQIKKFLKDFQQAFDIDRIKDRMDHVYKEGPAAEDAVINYLKEELENL